jgi:hypothetical protein
MCARTVVETGGHEQPAMGQASKPQGQPSRARAERKETPEEADRRAAEAALKALDALYHRRTCGAVDADPVLDAAKTVARDAILAIWGGGSMQELGDIRGGVERAASALALPRDVEAIRLTGEMADRVRTADEAARARRVREYVIRLRDTRFVEDQGAAVDWSAVLPNGSMSGRAERQERIRKIRDVLIGTRKVGATKKRQLTPTGMLVRILHILQWGEVHESTVAKETAALAANEKRYEARTVARESK